MKYVLGIDIGTSGTKTVLFDEKGTAISSALCEYPMSQPHNGWAEQDPKDWWNAVCTTVSQVVKDSNVPTEKIIALGMSGQMHGLVMLDKDNNVLRPSIIWCDQRTAEECEDIERIIGKQRLIEITANPALTGFTASKIMWVKKHEPQIFEKCCHILLPKDYIRFMLTGEYATDVSDASGMQLLDVPNRCWSNEVTEKLGIDMSLLPKVYESPEITGSVTKQAAQLTGLAEGTKVVGGAGDNAAAAVGTGVVCDGDAFTTIGTSGVVFAHTDNITIDPAGRVHTFCCAVPNAWHVMGVTQAAGLSLRWLRDNVCSAEIEEAHKRNIDPYIIMDDMAERSTVGSNRLLYLPYLMGERTPHLDPNARGAFIGLSAMHTRADIIRSVMEGVSFALQDCREVFFEMGLQQNSMRICGGGANSKLWQQMLSSIYGIPISKTISKEGPALGAAILALVGTGIYKSVKDACDAIIALCDEANPDLVSHSKYQDYYRIYKNLYKSLKCDFKELAKLE